MHLPIAPGKSQPGAGLAVSPGAACAHDARAPLV